MDRLRLARELAGQRAWCAGRSPFYVQVLGELEAEAAGGAGWLEPVERAWNGRRFAIGWEAAHLLLAGLHYSALAGEAPELAASYPSCGGSGRDPGGAPGAFLRRAPRAFFERLRRFHVQTNEVDRSVVWRVGAAAVLGEDLPFHLVELGTSAGLNLIGDYLPQPCRFLSMDGAAASPPPGWDRRPQPVLTRAGLDLQPRRLARRADRLWLKACVWADDLARLERLERAIAVFLALQRRGAGPRVERCTFSEAAAWLLENRPARAGEGLVVFNAIATVYQDDAEYCALRQGMARALAPWGERAVWLEYERARDSAGGPLELRVHRVVDGALRSGVLAFGAPRPTELRLGNDWEFLTRGTYG